MIDLPDPFLPVQQILPHLVQIGPTTLTLETEHLASLSARRDSLLTPWAAYRIVGSECGWYIARGAYPVVPEKAA